MFKLRVRWGEAFHSFNEYEFDTEAERSAFIHGADEASGWMDWQNFMPNPDGSWRPESEEGYAEEDEDD